MTDTAAQARNALAKLRLQALGIEPCEPPKGLSNQVSFEGEHPGAIQEYAKLICEHVEYLNELINNHRFHLLPVSRKRFTWPILRSIHPLLCQDERSILKKLEIGRDRDRYFDQWSKWKPGGAIAYFLDELLFWVDSCKNPPSRLKMEKRSKASLRCSRRLHAEAALAHGVDTLYFHQSRHPVLGALKTQLKPKERAAAALKSLSKETFREWEILIIGIVEESFKNPDCVDFLQIFTTASTKTPGRAKEYVKRKLRNRLASFAGIKR